MTKSEQHDPLPVHVANAIHEVANRHLILSNGLSDLGPLVKLGRRHFGEVFPEVQLAEGTLSDLYTECITHLRDQKIPRRQEHSNNLSAVRKIDADLQESAKDFLTGTSHELVQNSNPPNYDLATQPDQPLSA